MSINTLFLAGSFFAAGAFGTVFLVWLFSWLDDRNKRKARR